MSDGKELQTLRERLLPMLAVILCPESQPAAKLQAWLGVATALGVTLKDVVDAIPERA